MLPWAVPADSAHTNCQSRVKTIMQHSFVRRFWTHHSWSICKVFLCFALALLTVLSSTAPSYALDVKDVPNPRQEYGGWVTDMVDMLSPRAEEQLNQMIGQLEAENGTEIAVVTVPETHPSSTPKAFSTELFNEWGIGKADQDNGVLFLVSQGDRRTEIETGYGIETVLPNAEVAHIIATQVTPSFKQGNFEAGIVDGTQALIDVLGDRPINADFHQANSPSVSRNTSSPSTGIWTQLLICLAIPGGLLGVIVLLFNGIKAKVNRTYLSPFGSTHLSPFPLDNVHCEECSKPMNKVEAAALAPYLSRPQIVAQDIGSLRCQGWQCPRCTQTLNLDESNNRTTTNSDKTPEHQSLPLHLLTQQFSRKASYCKTCKELTVLKQETILRQPTRDKAGLQQVKKHCQCCDTIETKKTSIPKLSTYDTLTSKRRPSTNRRSTKRSGSSWNNGYQNYGYGGFSGGSGSSGGSDFGGGSSGGGGAGGDW